MGLFSTTIKVPVAALQDYATRMQGYADDNAEIFNRLNNSLLCLKGSGQWQGTSLEAIVDATKKNEEKFKEAIDELQALAEFLEKFVTEISEKDAEIKREIEAVN